MTDITACALKILHPTRNINIMRIKHALINHIRHQGLSLLCGPTMLADVFVAHFPFADSIDPSQSDVNVLIQIDVAKLSSIQDTPAGNRPYSMLCGNSAPEGQNKYLQHNE
jgi:hypothetical protein